MMDLANMLFGFFRTHAGSDVGAAAATTPSACIIAKMLQRNLKRVGNNLQDSISSFLGNGGREISVRRLHGLDQL